MGWRIGHCSRRIAGVEGEGEAFVGVVDGLAAGLDKDGAYIDGLAALGFLVAWLVDNVQGYHAIQMTLLVPLWVVSGAMFPMSAEHPGLAAVMRVNPVAYAVSATRRALAGGSAPGALPGSSGRDVAVLAAFAAAALALAVIASRRRRA